MRLSIGLVIAIWGITQGGLTGCQALKGQNSPPPPTLSTSTESCPQYSPEQNEGVTSVLPETFHSSQRVRGQKLYVPFYSQIYQPEGLGHLELSGTLSISNTSETEEIRLTKVDYVNTSGKLVKQCLEGKHLLLSPLATTQFGVSRQDDSGGVGANFIVEWVAEKSVTAPVVEVVMTTFSGTQGYSFTSSGRVMEEFEE